MPGKAIAKQQISSKSCLELVLSCHCTMQICPKIRFFYVAISTLYDMWT